MTLIEDREALEPRVLSGKRTHDLDPNPFDESGSDEEFLIANEGYSDDEESHHNYNRDFFSLPTLGLNYFNNLNLSLNLNLNLRNSPLWRIYENSSFTKPGFLSHYLGKHSDDVLDLNEDEISPDTRSYFTITNFLRRHGFHSYEDEFSEEAILERYRFKKLQKEAEGQDRKFVEDEYCDPFLSELEIEDKEKLRLLTTPRHLQDDIVANHCSSDAEIFDVCSVLESDVQSENGKASELSNEVKDMKHAKIATSLNPFYNRVRVTFWDFVKICILSIILLPVKVLLMIPTLTLAFILSLIGMYGLSFNESQSRPLPKWRRAVRWIIANVAMRVFVLSTGFIWNIKETGKRAKPEEAPIFVVGPHSSYFDAFVVILLGAPSVVAKLSTRDIPVFGRLVTFTQAVYVSRESKGSRKQTMEVLKTRAQGVYNGSGMPQIFIFPEGTCGNRSSLIKFKPGAFVPQVPVQPVLIRYPNRFDCATWTFDGPPVLTNIWYSLAQFFNRIEIEYLPVYVPNEEEKNDPGLFGENVRKVMSEALNVPLSDYQFEDGSLLAEMRGKLVQKLRSIHRAKKALDLSGSAHESTAIFHYIRGKQEKEMKFHQFQREFFHVSSEDTTVPEVHTVFNLFKKEDEEVADIRPYLLLTCMLYEDKSLRIQDIPKTLCQIHGLEPDAVTEDDLRNLTEAFFGASEKEHRPIQSSSNVNVQQVDEKSSYLTFDALKQRLSRYIEFAMLFADEVTERLPKTYPSFEERDKLPKRKLKSE